MTCSFLTDCGIIFIQTDFSRQDHFKKILDNSFTRLQRRFHFNRAVGKVLLIRENDDWHGQRYRKKVRFEKLFLSIAIHWSGIQRTKRYCACPEQLKTSIELPIAYFHNVSKRRKMKTPSLYTFQVNEVKRCRPVTSIRTLYDPTVSLIWGRTKMYPKIDFNSMLIPNVPTYTYI